MQIEQKYQGVLQLSSTTHTRLSAVKMYIFIALRVTDFTGFFKLNNYLTKVIEAGSTMY